MKTFQEYLNLRIVRRQQPNPSRAKSLIDEAEKKAAFLQKVLQNLSLEETDPNFIVESCYDILIELVRAAMFFDGYHSQNSHEAEVSYLGVLLFPEPEAIFMDELRYFRNGIKYYGKIFDRDYAEKVLEFHNRMHPQLTLKLKKHLETLGKSL